MRNAEAKDHWRRLYGRVRPNQLVAVHLERETFPASGSLLDLPSLAVLCGGNGAGKSSLLAMLHAAATGNNAALPDHLRSGRVRVRVRSNRVERELVHDLATDVVAEGLPFSEVLWIDSSKDAEAARRRFNGESDLQELLAQYGSRDLTESQLDLVRYVTRKSYSRVSLTTVEDETLVSGLSEEGSEESEEPGEAPEVTHFEVTDQGVTYDTRSMGAGELASLSVLVKLFDAPSGSLVLVEEPETHVSPASQRQLLNVVARLANERQLSVVVSTHSVEMLHLTPPEAVRVVEPVMGGSVELRRPTSLHEVRHFLGTNPTPACLVIVEDRLAAVVLQELLSASRLLAILGADIAFAGSNTEAVATATRLNGLQPKVPAVAVVDGDQREKLGGCLYLPGVEAPETELIGAIRQKTGALARRIGRTEANVSAALTHIEGQNCHEAWHELWSRLDINSESLARAAVQTWLTIPHVKPVVRRLAAGIQGRIMT